MFIYIKSFLMDVIYEYWCVDVIHTLFSAFIHYALSALLHVYVFFLSAKMRVINIFDYYNSYLLKYGIRLPKKIF